MSPHLSSLLPDFSREITQDDERLLILSVCQKCGAETTCSATDGGSLKQWEFSHKCEIESKPASITSSSVASLTTRAAGWFTSSRTCSLSRAARFRVEWDIGFALPVSVWHLSPGLAPPNWAFDIYCVYHRHFAGAEEKFAFISYEKLLERFLNEVRELRQKKESI